MISQAPSPQFYERQRGRYAEALHRAAVCASELERLASRPISRDEIQRLLRAYATSSKMIDIYRAMAEAAGKYKPQCEPAIPTPRNIRRLEGFYQCPVCEEQHYARRTWNGDWGDEFELPMRLMVEAALRSFVRLLHPELVFDPERLSFR
jgi:hypothetical protein